MALKQFGIYNDNNEGICSIDGVSAKEALEKFKTEDPERDSYNEGFWAEELDA